MTRYHVNPTNGVPGLCADPVHCPFGYQPAYHYEDKLTAKANREAATLALLKVYEEFQAQTDKDKAEFDSLSNRLKELRRRVDKAGLEDEELEELSHLEDAIYLQTNILRRSIYRTRLARRAARHALVLPLPDSIEEPAPKATTSSKPRKSSKVNFTEPNPKADGLAAQELAAWGGISIADAQQEIASYDPQGPLTRDQHVVALFQKYSPNPSPMAFVDLETSGFTPSTGEIIEIGILHVDSRGEVLNAIDERFDLESSYVRSMLGTGNVDIHKIEPQELEGKRVFTDMAVQLEIGLILNDPEVVICAHNAPFENRWLDHYLDGFQDMHNQKSAFNLKTGRIPTPNQDTQILSKLLMHSTDNDRLEAFAEGNGVPYDNSHSAFPDAQMTAQAYSNFRRALQESPLGQRPYLS